MRHKRVDALEGVSTFKTKRQMDDRGDFTKCAMKSFSSMEFDSIAFSRNITTGTIRGLHFQSAPFTEEKIVSCIQGSIFDVAVDLRPKSNTFGFWMGLELSPENAVQLLLPKGVAHGFQTLLPNSIVHYLISEQHSPKNSHTLNPFFDSVIDWPLCAIKISEKDSKGLSFNVASAIYRKSLDKTIM